jgi:hypothetical protein
VKPISAVRPTGSEPLVLDYSDLESDSGPDSRPEPTQTDRHGTVDIEPLALPAPAKPASSPDSESAATPPRAPAIEEEEEGEASGEDYGSDFAPGQRRPVLLPRPGPSAEELRVRERYDVILASHISCALDLAVSHCSADIIRVMTKVLTAATLYDFSDELLVSVRDYGIFALPQLTEAHLLDLFDAIFSGMSSLLQANQSVDGLFAILATVLNFGQQLSDVASLYTGVHECVLERLATSVTSVMQLLSQRLFAPIASSIQQDGLIFADEVAMNAVVAETRKFLNNCAAYHLGAEIFSVSLSLVLSPDLAGTAPFSTT